ncbi:hypothetical protein FZEAL_1381 [Fusarium zealandicum]|uniref:Uncharacterized protein n=1 Tax=Fusarium zealandicum TaxID=1053134 RepID=A0A8H4USW1_9HYPO|nr:hypothetical protein FZEAL_1381 [Fusarium zealandicum]
MSTPRVKRQFAGASADPSQRQITSFFNARSCTDPVDATTNRAPQPALPSAVQSNLLSVGMRVRKSVPEGYKTVGPSAFKIWTDNAPVATSITDSAPAKGLSRELLPFCGINKVGGLDSQPEFEGDDDVPDLNSLPELTMSQESTESAASAWSSRKRIFDDDDEPAVDSWVLSSANEGDARVFAIPVSQAQKGARFEDPGQENRATGTDFEEAEFLVFGADADMDQAN